MPKYRGRVDCYLNPIIGDSVTYFPFSSKAWGEYFTNLIQHISSSGPDLGIEMIAANYGIGGSGFNFWDQTDAPGPRSWACFRFHSASLGKFDCLIFQMTGSNTNTSYGGVSIGGQANTVFNVGYNSNYFIGISFASHPSGSNVTQSDGPWNGTYSLTSASLGNPIWKLNADGKGAFFPRNNGILGAFSGSRNYLSPFASVSVSTEQVPIRQHIIVSEDSLTFLHDSADNGNTKVMHFGSFLPRSGTQQDSPYLMFTNASEGTSPITSLWSTVIGDLTTPSYGTDVSNGALSNPYLVSGSKKFTFGYLGMNELSGYNVFVNSGSFDMSPLWPIIYEGNDLGILGVANHIYRGVGMESRTVSELSSSAAFGRIGVLTETKLIVPWSGAPPGNGTTRAGRNFSIG